MPELENYIEWVEVFLKGVAMGSADAVPGVSGGTIALITGIYQRFISAITSIDIEKILDVLKGVNPSNFEEAMEAFHEMDGFFLVVLGTGIITALVLVLRVIHYLLVDFPVLTFGFFFGLIAFSVVVLYRQVELSNFNRKLAAISGFLLAFIVSGYATSALGHSLPVVFIAGTVAVSAMILPGISGSLILLILGQYEYMTGVLSNFTDALLTGEKIFSTGKPVLTFVAGAFVGLFTVAHMVKWALQNYRKATLAFLVSLVAGALRAPVVEVEKVLAEQGSTWLSVLPEFSAAALFGALVIFALDYRAGIVELE